ncbi:MAG: S9 family peptidase [Peptoniphilaceae bacterium]|nr:S9 family peptidase [Peptoniphilaceae bacterium]MDY6018177.1 S9 family peptidase [Anaerococcus sp.]
MDKTQLKDILSYEFINSLEISGDKKNLAYKTTKANEKENRYDTFLNLLDLDSKKFYRISDNPNISIFTFDKESKLIFKEKTDDEYDYFYSKDLSAQVASQAFKIDKNVSSIEHIKDNVFLIFATDKKSKEDKEKSEDQDKVFKEVTSLPFWFNGQGYLKLETVGIYLYNKDENKLKHLMTSNINNDISLLKISDDLKKLAYTKAIYSNGYNKIYEDLYIYDLEKNEEKLLLKEKFSYAYINFYKDGLVFVGSDMKKHGINQDPFIYKVDFEGNLIKISDDNFDIDFGVSTGTDARFGHDTTFRQENEKLYFTATKNEDSKLYCFNLETGKLDLLIEGGLESFALGDDKIYYSKMSKDSLCEIYEEGKTKALVENKIKTRLGKIEEFFFESNGDKLRGYVLLPTDFDPNKKYPTLLSIHGGPKTEFSDIFHHEHQVFANDGYIIIYTNPHGASGNGVAFSDIRGRYGEIDYEDLMNFTNEAIKRYPQIDTENMGVYGGSYGGFMTNWIISHTDRFKAANAQRCISNWISFYGVSDIGYYFASDQTDSNPWDSLDKMWELSPLKHAKNVKTPTLFIHSDMDYRCPLEQGLQMYTRIKLNGVETKMFIFHGENHELSRSGKPKGRIKRLTEIKNWFDGHLK